MVQRSPALPLVLPDCAPDCPFALLCSSFGSIYSRRRSPSTTPHLQARVDNNHHIRCLEMRPSNANDPSGQRLFGVCTLRYSLYIGGKNPSISLSLESLFDVGSVCGGSRLHCRNCSARPVNIHPSRTVSIVPLLAGCLYRRAIAYWGYLSCT